MGWALIRIWAILVYVFMFLPVAVVVLLSFNASQFGSFPMTGVSIRWFVELANNEAILRAFRTSMILGGLTALVSTTLGVLASLALVRYAVPGRNLITTLLIAPILVPEVVLAVALLLFLNFLSVNKSFLLLLLGHVIFTLPFVILVVQARLVGIRRDVEEAAMSLGASPVQTFAMLRNSISPEINALGTVMIFLTVGLPLLGVAIARRMSTKRGT
jgi:spermidine/putrescine transport system permease protein